jgi:hypothetical protein
MAQTKQLSWLTGIAAGLFIWEVTAMAFIQEDPYNHLESILCGNLSDPGAAWDGENNQPISTCCIASSLRTLSGNIIIYLQLLFMLLWVLLFLPKLLITMMIYNPSCIPCGHQKLMVSLTNCVP